MPTSSPLPRIVRRRSALHGFGVFALEPINKNKRIIDYAGELIHNSKSSAREAEYLEEGCIWVFRINRAWSRDAGVGGQRRALHQSLLHAKLLGRSGRPHQDDLDSRLAADLSRRRAHVRLRNGRRSHDPMCLPAGVQDEVVSSCTKENGRRFRRPSSTGLAV
jgi:hypothetical protein